MGSKEGNMECPYLAGLRIWFYCIGVSEIHELNINTLHAYCLHARHSLCPIYIAAQNRLTARVRQLRTE